MQVVTCVGTIFSTRFITVTWQVTGLQVTTRWQVVTGYSTQTLHGTQHLTVLVFTQHGSQQSSFLKHFLRRSQRPGLNSTSRHAQCPLSTTFLHIFVTCT